MGETRTVSQSLHGPKTKKKGNQVLTGTKGVAFGIALMQTAGREDLLIKYGSAIEDLIGGRPRPEFREADADNYMYVGVRPGSEQMVKRKSYVYGERRAL